RSILNLYLRIGTHILVLNSQGSVTNGNPRWVDSVYNLLNCNRWQVFISSSGIPKDQCKIIFRNSIQGNWKEVFWSVRHVIFRIFGGTIVFVGINSEKGKITGMSRPDPVVCIATKLPNRGRRSAYQSNIFKGFNHKKHVLVAFIKSTYTIFLPGFFRRSLHHIGNVFFYLFLLVGFSHCFGNTIHYLVCKDRKSTRL